MDRSADAAGPVGVCAIQMDPRLGEPERNAERLEREIAAGADEGARLLVSPEAALTGYVFRSLEEARAGAVSATGPELGRLGEAAGRLGVHAVVGAIERDGDLLYNSAFLLGPDGLLGRYRKIHTLCLGADRFTRPGGEAFRVFSLPFGRIGLHICYDGSFPESARTLRLLGAQLLILPTNWPRLRLRREMVQIRAYENHAYYLAVNRVGSERGVTFEGGSAAADPDGNLLFQAGPEAGRFHAEMDLAASDETREVVAAGEYELDLIEDRWPRLYAPITAEPPEDRRTGSRESA